MNNDCTLQKPCASCASFRMDSPSYASAADTLHKLTAAKVHFENHCWRVAFIAAHTFGFADASVRNVDYAGNNFTAALIPKNVDEDDNPTLPAIVVPFDVLAYTDDALKRYLNTLTWFARPQETT